MDFQNIFENATYTITELSSAEKKLMSGVIRVRIEKFCYIMGKTTSEIPAKLLSKFISSVFDEILDETQKHFLNLNENSLNKTFTPDIKIKLNTNLCH